MANEESKAIENLLEIQLTDQKESLCAINEALVSDPSNPELLSVHEELLSAIKEAEEALLHLKRARLLEEADIVLNGLSHDDEVKAEHLSELEPEKIEEKKDLDGSKCRFRHSDGRWYNGRIIGFEGSDSAKISFLTPTSESMMMCKFFMQQRCRFGSSCRSSHGLDVPISSLKNYEQIEWKQAMVGSKIWAVSGSKYDIWRKAELESWDDELQVGGVVFRDDGSSAKVGSDAMALSEYAQMTDDDGEGEEEDEEGSASGSEESVSSDYDDEFPQGIGFLESINQSRGVQTDTALFAKWENHTRGIASKMMANMGYREGMGLGASGQGMLNPVLVKVLPAKRSLDYALQHIKNGEGESEKQKKKKTSRGGKRKRGKKFAEAARAAKQEEESKPDLFSFINEQIFPSRDEKVNGIEPVKRKQNKGPVDRKDLVAYEDEVRDLKLEMMKLEQMVKRNKKDQIVSEAATRRLNEVRRALASTLATQAAASNAVESKEKEKKWLKF